MAADRKPAGEAARQEHIWLVALYAEEERTGELLERLGALGVETSEATVVRVDLAGAQRLPTAAPPGRARPMSLPARSAVTGAIIGSSVFLLIGLILYEASLIRLQFVEGLFAHALGAAILGAVVGALGGGLLGLFSWKRRPARRAPLPLRLPTSRDGFLVAVKMQPDLAEQAEEIARRLGAKEILI